MSDLSRIGAAVDASPLKKFELLLASRAYSNRSEAFRDLIRDKLVKYGRLTITSKGVEL
jgi:CopG family transcriptional regulator, nickel-responsive regulator